jgi:hypothetical protein
MFLLSPLILRGPGAEGLDQIFIRWGRHSFLHSVCVRVSSKLSPFRRGFIVAFGISLCIRFDSSHNDPLGSQALLLFP